MNNLTLKAMLALEVITKLIMFTLFFGLPMLLILEVAGLVIGGAFILICYTATVWVLMEDARLEYDLETRY